MSEQGDQVDRWLRGTREPSPEQGDGDAPRRTSFDGGAREQIPAPASSFASMIEGERELRRRERAELAKHYDQVVVDPATLSND